MKTEQVASAKIKLSKQELKSNYHIFGNKGNVWSGACHIAKSDLSGLTLCGTPMLSSNWARIENIQIIGCQECIELYLASTKIEDQ
jgi:hypothetical protein